MSVEVLHTVAELAKAWRVSKTYIYDLITRGELVATNIGRGRAKIRVSASAVEAYQRHKARAVTPPQRTARGAA